MVSQKGFWSNATSETLFIERFVTNLIGKSPKMNLRVTYLFFGPDTLAQWAFISFFKSLFF